MQLNENNKIKAILFDMVGVLLVKKKNYTPKTKNELNARRIEKLYNHVDDEKLLSEVRSKLNLTKEEINKALPFIPEKFEEYDKLWKLLPKLKKKYKLAVINNGNNIARKYWMKKFDFSIFDAFIVSAEVGVKKPNPEIYLITCKKLEVKPENCLFTDDVKENTIAAKKLGMKVFWWKKSEKNKSFNKLLNKTIDRY